MSESKKRRSINKLYDIRKEPIGRGSFAEVKYAVDRRTGQPCAIKVIKKAAIRDNFDALSMEASILQSCDHSNIVKLYGFYQSSSKVYIVMEMVSGGELFDHIVRRHHYTEDDARIVIKQVAEALHYLHARGIVHRDLKPENLLMDTSDPENPVAKLADFGLGHVLREGEHLVSCAGTPGYTAPEVYLAKKYTTSPDIYSLGVICYVMLGGFLPFDDSNMSRLVRDVVAGKWHFRAPYFDNITPAAKDLITKCMAVDPSKRITADQVLKHPWITGEAVIPVTPLPAAQREMRKYLAKLRLRAGINAIAAARRLARLADALKDMDVAAILPARHVGFPGDEEKSDLE